MNDVDLVAAGHAAFTPYVLEQLSSRIGLPPDAIRHVTERAVPATVAAMMAKSVTPEGARRVFGVIMSAESNARIGTQLHGLTASSHGLKGVERMGHALALGIVDSREIASLSDQIAAQTGVPPQAAHALTDVASAVVFGVTRHHVLLEQGTPAGLPGLLAYQWPVVAPWLAEGFATALGFENAAAFADTVPQRLVETAAAMPQTSAAAGLNGMAPESLGAASGPRVTGFTGEVAGDGSAAASPVAPPVKLLSTAPPVEPPRRRGRKWILSVLVLLVLLIGVIVYGYRQQTSPADETASQTGNSASATSGTLSPAQPASAASVPAASLSAAAAVEPASAAASGAEMASSDAAAGSEVASASGPAPAAASATPASAASQ